VEYYRTTPLNFSPTLSPRTAEAKRKKRGGKRKKQKADAQDSLILGFRLIGELGRKKKKTWGKKKKTAIFAHPTSSLIYLIQGWETET